jgi:hypothetical protein
LKDSLVQATIEQAEALAPRSRSQWERARREIRIGLRHRLAARVPTAADLLTERASEGRLFLGRRGAGDRVPALILPPTGSARRRGTLVVNPVSLQTNADRQHAALVSELRRQGHVVMVIEVLGTQADSPVPSERAGFFTTYNRSLIAERVQDVLTGLAFLRSLPGVRSVNLVGEGKLGPVCLLARSLDSTVARAAIDADAFEYRSDADEPPDRLLPGVLRFGGLRAAAALAAPGDLLLHHTGDALDPAWASKAYELWKQPDALRTSRTRLAPDEVVAWLTERET